MRGFEQILSFPSAFLFCSDAMCSSHPMRTEKIHAPASIVHVCASSEEDGEPNKCIQTHPSTSRLFALIHCSCASHCGGAGW